MTKAINFEEIARVCFFNNLVLQKLGLYFTDEGGLVRAGCGLYLRNYNHEIALARTPKIALLNRGTLFPGLSADLKVLYVMSPIGDSNELLSFISHHPGLEELGILALGGKIFPANLVGMIIEALPYLRILCLPFLGELRYEIKRNIFLAHKGCFIAFDEKVMLRLANHRAEKFGLNYLA
jgi:hypothetical protein